LFLKKRDYDRAIVECGEAIRLDPNYAVAYNNRAVVFNDKADYDHALADLAEAIRLDPRMN
jgi:tetratricopeptide (TPR) repeat protein